MINYDNTFNNRYKKFLYAQEKYPLVMKDEYINALKICELNENDVFINIPADYKTLENLFNVNIKYIPIEINKNFASIGNYLLCEDLSNLPFTNQSIDVILSLASLHHSSQIERVGFYKECLRLTKKLIIGDVIKGSTQDIWLNDFVNKNNSCGHKGFFFNEEDRFLMEKEGFEVQTKRIKYTWNFKNKEEMIDFCKNLFNLDLISDAEIYEGIKNILKQKDNKFDWELIYFICKNPFRISEKPKEWDKLPLYTKINFYKSILNQSYAQYVDKLLVKNKVKEILGTKIEVANVVKIIKNINELKESDLCDNYLIKSTHGSGWNIDLKEEKNIEKIKQILNTWNKIYDNYNENQYKYIEPRFFIEEKIEDKIVGKTGNAIVYMFRCIHGEPVTIGVKYKDNQNIYDIDWKLLHKKLKIEINKPENLDEMLNISRQLSKIFEFVRIDLYLSKDKIYFSEYTFTPNGAVKFYNEKKEIELGKMWR